MKKYFVLLTAFLIFASAAMAAETFPVSNLSLEYESMMGMTTLQGEITNNSGKSYETCVFKMSFYDDNQKLLGTADVIVMNFNKGETVTFDAFSEKDLRKATNYKIRLDAGY